MKPHITLKRVPSRFDEVFACCVFFEGRWITNCYWGIRTLQEVWPQVIERIAARQSLRQLPVEQIVVMR